MSSDPPSRKAQWIKSVSLVVIVGLAASLLERDHARVTEAMYVLKSMVFAAMGLITSHPLTLGLANGGLALLLLVFVRGEHHTVPGKLAARLIIQLNRSAGHLEALFTWLTLVIWWAPNLWLQVVGMMIIVVLGPVAMDSLTYGRHPSWWRLLIPAAVTLAGVTLVVYVASPQWRQLAPLVGLVLAGLVPRTAWSLWRERALHVNGDPEAAWPQFVDRIMMVIALGTLILVPLHALRPGHTASVENRKHRTLHWESCTPPAPAPFALFIVADSQFHALDGKRSGFHMDVVDREVPVSVRPVELDLLSAVTLRAFADVYQDLRSRAPDMKWVHLGDSADIGCISELERFLALAPRFGLGSLAAVIPGNHDGAFLGNLSWHPDWDDACPGGRSSPDFARARLATLMPPREDRVTSTGHDFLATVTVLGKLGEEEVIGVFLDTTDVPWDGVGIAGAQGGISDDQLAWVEESLARFSAGRVLIFGHHPVDQWTPRSRRKLDRLGERLGRRLWGVVSAHTHLAAMRQQLVGGQVVPEFIVGSTIDPPQEAALLEGDAGGHLTMRTLPAVRRTEMTCDDDHAKTVSAQTCRAVFAKLRETPACAALVVDGPSPTSRQCKEDTKAVAPLLDDHVTSPEDLDCLQESRAGRLLACLGVTEGDGERVLHDARLPEEVLEATEKDPDAAILKGLKSLRTPHVARAIGNAIFKGKERRGFRVVQFSIHGNHLHFVVEAAGRRTLAAGAKGLAVRVARAVNRATGHKGQVIAERYHARAITTLRETRAVLVYVLTNWKHHEHRANGIDPWSSGRWFRGWRGAPPPPAAPSPVAPAKTWLLNVGWYRLGPIGMHERPRS